jgi:hypothetical protein
VIEEARAIWKDRRTFTAGKQRLTATRLTELLRERGHTVSGRTVRRLVGEFLRLDKEVTVPLIYQPGEAAQVDFFEVWIELAAVRASARRRITRDRMISRLWRSSWGLEMHDAVRQVRGTTHRPGPSRRAFATCPSLATTASPFRAAPIPRGSCPCRLSATKRSSGGALTPGPCSGAGVAADLAPAG